MSSPQTVTDVTLRSYKKLASGKVRELYEIDDSTLLFIATDRVSAYDVILANGIPSKGELLTKLSAHWFSLFSKRLPELKTHFVSLDLPAALQGRPEGENLHGRSMQVRRLEILPIESIVRGYITGSAWSEYKKSGTVHGINMPEGLRECEKLNSPLWTPSTKAEIGEKDENITPEQAAEIIGKSIADQVEKLSLEIYTLARDYAAERGILVADTKFEFALDRSTAPPTVVLSDEVLTPDSSRFWDAAKYEIGRSQDSLDKQFLRDWLTKHGLKGKEGVTMPPEIVETTKKGYVEAYERLTGCSWS